MKQKRCIVLGLVAILLIALGVVLSRTILYFGPGLPQRDDRAAMRELEASLTGADPSDFRAADLLRDLGMALGWPVVDDLVAADMTTLEGRDDELDYLASLPAIVRRWDDRTTPMTFIDDVEAITARRIVDVELRRADGLHTTGRSEQALKPIERAVRLTQLLIDQPDFVSRLTAGRLVSKILEQTLAIASDPDTPGQVVDQLGVLISEMQIPPFAHALEGEKIQAAEVIRTEFGESILSLASAGAQFARYERLAESVESWFELPTRQRLDEPFKRSEQHLMYDVADILMGDVNHMAAQENRMQLELAGGELALIIEAHRVAAGEYPVSLDDLTQSLPTDPFAYDGLFRYVRHQNGFVLYSVGHDGVDDHGAQNPETPEVALTSEGTGFDFIIHQVPPPSDSPPPP